jgi:chromosome segregation ATPase
MSEQNQSVTFQAVEKIASEMLSQGVKPTVRGVIAVTGGKTETVTRHLRDFNEKRENEVGKMAGEIGSSKVASLIAGEIQNIIDKKTILLSDAVESQKQQVEELLGLLEEQANDSESLQESTSLAIAKAIQDSSEKVEKANVRADKCAQAQQQAQKEAEIALSKADSLIKSETDKAKALVDVANDRTGKAEQEAQILQEQVKGLSVDVAKLESGQELFEEQKITLTELRLELAEQKTETVRISTENKSLEKDVTRLEADNAEYKGRANDFYAMQSQLVEAQKLIAQLKVELSDSEKEREVLTKQTNVK